MRNKAIFRSAFALALAVLLSSSGEIAVAQVVGAQGASRSWSPVFAAASPAQMTALQGFLASPLGAQALALSPGLEAVTHFDPRSAEHQAILGAMPLPAAAAMTPQAVAAAYSAARVAVTESLRARAAEVLKSVAEDGLAKKGLIGADRELSRVAARFSIFRPEVPAEAAQVADLAAAARLGRSMSSARRLAREFLASAPSESPAGAVLAAEAGARKPLVSLQPSHPVAKTAELGVDLSAMDATVRPQNDFFRYVNGTWIKDFKIPADKSGYGVFDTLFDKSQEQIRTIIEEAAAAPNASPDNRRIASLYKSYMDEAGIEARGAAPVAQDLARIDAVKSKSGLPGLFAWAGEYGIGTPVGLGVGQDSKDPSKYIVSLGQSGLGLPDRDYYFEDAPAAANIRAKYVEYITKLLTLAGESEPARKAAEVYALEKALAEKQWTQVELRDAVKTYNKMKVSELDALAPGFAWKSYLRRSKVRPQEKTILVDEPSYLTGFAQILKDQPLDAWKSYMKVRMLTSAAGSLSKAFVDASFDYRGRVLNGMTENRPRWKRGVSAVDGSVGEAIGRVYVQKHFPESSKKRMLQLVENLRAAYAQRISAVTWMSDATKAKALEKLRKFTPKIGYPDKWIDYSKLRVKPDDLLGNMRRVAAFEHARAMAKLGKPVDRGEWGMTPQDINAYYNPVMNEIVFPAGILQAPFFNPEADDAVNYGAIGGIIGHEMSHGFDDQGAEYDGDGRLENWWTPADKAAFQARTAMLVKQFNAFEPIKGQHVNGELTLGENIADLGGLTIALQAYKLSLGGKEAPVINGFTGEQRVFLGWAQAWRGIYRDESLSQQMKTDPHAPNETRVNGVMRNMPEFYKAFGLKPGDELYLPENERVGIW
jgi:putative endopeptidase